MEPDIPIYTTLINSYYKSNQIDLCWKVYYEQVVGYTPVLPD